MNVFVSLSSWTCKGKQCFAVAKIDDPVSMLNCEVEIDGVHCKVIAIERPLGRFSPTMGLMTDLAAPPVNEKSPLRLRSDD